jgi:hypothetical protein
MTLAPVAPGPTTTEVRWPDGAIERVAVTSDGARVEHSFVVPPGTSVAALRTSGGAQLGFPQVTRPYYLRVLDAVVTDSAFEPFGRFPRDPRAASYLSPFGAI